MRFRWLFCPLLVLSACANEPVADEAAPDGRVVPGEAEADKGAEPPLRRSPQLCGRGQRFWIAEGAAGAGRLEGASPRFAIDFQVGVFAAPVCPEE